MSTKTTFKRIALVTVAALGFGTVAAIAPASAAATATSVTIGNTTVYGFVGSESLTAKINMTVTSSAALDTSNDSITITAKYTSKPTGSVQPDSVTADSSTAQASLPNNQFRLWESSTANWTESAVTDSRTIKVVAGAAAETGTAFQVATLAFKPTTPGTYTFTVTPSAPSGATTAAYTAGTVTFVVRSLGAKTGDGAVASPYDTLGGVAGAGNYVTVKAYGQSRTDSALGTRLVVTGSTILGTTNSANLNTEKTVVTIPGLTNGSVPSAENIQVLTPAVGTITVKSYLETAEGVYSSTASNTVTITVRATAQSQVYSYTEAYIATGNATPDDVTDAAAVLTVPSASSDVSTTPVATISVDQYDVLEAALATANTKAITVEIATAGRVSTSSTAVGASTYVAVAAASANSQVFYVHPDGRAGTGVVTVKVNGVEVLKRSVSFFGTAAAIKQTTTSPSKKYLGIGDTMTISLYTYDSSDVVVSKTPTLQAISETASVVSVPASTSTGAFVVTGIAVGKSNIKVCVGACSTATITLTIAVEVTKKTGIAKLTLDKTSYAPGEKVTWTITATDSNGKPVADGTYAFFSAITSNMAVTGSLPTGSDTITGGVATGSFYAPAAGSGDFTLTATQGTAHDTYIAGLKAATAAGTTYTAVKDTVSATIVNAAADAAAAAAEEATAAANDATDAALSAAEAAEAATAMAQEAVDAVAELSAQVTSLISALKAQITALTNLVVKIQKKVKA